MTITRQTFRLAGAYAVSRVGSMLLFVSMAAVAGLTSHAQTFTVLYSFKGNASCDGEAPFAGLVEDGAGHFYGTTFEGGCFGGRFGNGTVFMVDTTGNERVLYRFGSHSGDGANPESALVRDAAGNLYGTTANGGVSHAGTVFRLGAHGVTVLHNFSGQPDGIAPTATLLRQPWGVLYGTTTGGGTRADGTVFRLDTTGAEVVLHSFWGGDGSGPNGPLVGGGTAGIFYGTTESGPKGSSQYGTVYRMDSTGKETVLYRFAGGIDGANPFAGLVRDVAGNLYGTTVYGGTFPPSCSVNSTSGCGVVFKLDTGGNETVLHSFIGGADGANPVTTLVQDASGNLYGTTENGGAGFGTVFKFDTAGNYSVVYTFTGGADGRNPNGLLLGADGSLYGTAAGGSLGFGTVFKLTP